MTGAELAVPIFASLIGAGTTLATSAQAQSAAKRAEKQRKDQQGKLEQEQAKREQQAAIDQERNVAGAKKKTKAGTMGGRADTILTSPIGVVGEETAAAKTLLGS